MKPIISIIISFCLAFCSLAPFSFAKEYTDVNTEYEGATVYATREQAIACFVNALGVEKFKVETDILDDFRDRDKISYAYIDEMATAVYLGLISGYEDSTLRPRETVNRAEALVILNRALSRSELPSWYDTRFTDTPDWAEKQINRLASAGIVKGYGDGTVGARDFLTIIQVNTLCDRIERVMGPMGDFYNYVNGRWIEDTKLPEGVSFQSDMGELTNTVNSRLTDIIFSLYKRHYNDGEAFPEESDENKIITVYSAAANQTYRDKTGLKPIEPMLDMIDGAKTVDDILKVMAELEKNGFSTLIKVSFDPDVKGEEDFLPAVSGGYTGLDVNLYRGDESDEFISIYKDYLIELFRISGETEPEVKAEKTVSICKAVANGVTLTGQELSKTVNIYKRNDVNRLYGGKDMGEYFTNAGFSKIDKIILYDEGLAKTVASLLKQNRVEDIKAYLKASVLDYSAVYTTTEMFNANQNYRNRMYGENYNNLPSDYGAQIVEELLGWELGEIYIERYFSENSKKIAEDITKDIIGQYKKLINSTDRMTREGKLQALKKLENIKVYSAYPDNIDEYKKKISLTPIEKGGSLMEYRMAYAREYVKKCDGILKGTDDRVTGWYLYPQTVNAMYDHTTNSITIPAGILQAPFFEASAGYEENLGGIGTVIAHEISHAFDATGAQFDEKGKLKSWWTEEDKKSFDTLCKKAEKEYSDIKYGDMYIDGKLTLNENLSDIAGVSCIIELAGEDNPRLGNVFESYAKVWRMKSTEEYDNMMLMTDNHSPNKVRVNRVLSNFDAFNEFYKIKEGDGMYIPEDKRINVWE